MKNAFREVSLVCTLSSWKIVMEIWRYLCRWNLLWTVKVNVHSKSPLMSPQWYNDDINGLFKIALLLQRNLRPHVKFQVLSLTQSQRVLGLESHPATTSWVSPKYSDLGYHRNVKALRSRKAHGLGPSLQICQPI